MQQVVQVKILNGPGDTYAYAWEGPEPLKIYDWVTLPGNVVNPEGSEGMVASVGANGYSGPLKWITGRGVSPLDFIRDVNKITSKDQASAVWLHARAAGVSVIALQVIESEGWARLGRLAREHGAGSRASGSRASVRSTGWRSGTPD